MQIKEYRIVMPLSLQEYYNGQLYSCAVAAKGETGGGEGVEVLQNESFDNYPLMDGKYCSGQYTRKIYHISSRIPRLIRLLIPNGSLEVVEEAWNAYPYCKTVITNPGYMKDSFMIVIESLHLADRGEHNNALELSQEKLAQREVLMVDIANDHILPSDYTELEDPCLCHSATTGRGPLVKDWISHVNFHVYNACNELTNFLQIEPVMTCYKVVTAEFKWLGLQTRVENLIHATERRIFTRFHRQIFCWMDKWHELSLEEIRILEERIRGELNEARRAGRAQGMQIDVS